jgi:hypothetical protein
MKSFRLPIAGRKIRFALEGCSRIIKNYFDSIAKFSDVCDTDSAALAGGGRAGRGLDPDLNS